MIKKRTLLSNIKDKTDVGNFEIVGYIKDIRRAKKKGFFITIEDISDSFDIFLSETYGLSKFDLVIVSGRKKNRIQISKIVKTSREKLKELAGGSYDEDDTVSAVKRARAGEQQQLNIERIKSEIAAQNEKMEEENKEKQARDILNDSAEYNSFEDAEEIEDVEIDEELNEIEDESVDEENDSFRVEQSEESSDDIDTSMDSSAEASEGQVNAQDSSSQAPQNDIDESFGTEGNESEEPYVGSEQDMQDLINVSEGQGNTNLQNDFTITTENLPFSKMKSLMTIISGNPGEIDIQVLGNEMKISEKGLNELKKLIQE